MTSNDISSRIDAWEERAMFTDAWRRSQKSRWRVEARATSVECHISSVGKLVEVVMAARVHEHDMEVRESEAVRGSFFGDN